MYAIRSYYDFLRPELDIREQRRVTPDVAAIADEDIVRDRRSGMQYGIETDDGVRDLHRLLERAAVPDHGIENDGAVVNGLV